MPIKSRFLNHLDVRQTGADEWTLLHEFAFVSVVLGRKVTVPKGFVTDFASVPRLPFAYWAAGGKGDAAAVLHDWGYRVKEITRAQADALFLEAMETDGSAFGIPAERTWRARAMAATVRAFGWIAWSSRGVQDRS